MNKEHWDNGACPKVDCRKGHCKCGLERVFLSAVLGDDSKDSPVAPKNGEYCNAIVVYEANNHVYIYSKEGIPTLVETGGDVEETIEQLEGQLAQEILDRQAADNTLQGEIDELKNSPDVVDIVATYADLQAYDTSKLGDNDVIRVLADEQHDGESSYYRWSKTTSTWTYIGSTGPYYTEDEIDDLLVEKQNVLTAGENIAIDNDTISADVGITFYVGVDEFVALPLNTSTPISIYKDRELTTLATETEMWEALYSDKVVKLATSVETPDETVQTYLVTACDDDYYDGRHIGFNIITNMWIRENYYDRVEFTWDYGATSPNAVKRANRCVRVEEMQGGTYNINGQLYANSGLIELRNTGNEDTLLLPKGIEGDSNFQLRIKPGHSVYIMEMSQTNAGGKKYLVFGATNGSDVEVALVEPNATAKLKLWTQYTDNLTTTNSDGQKVLSAYQGYVLNNRIGDLSTLQTTAKTSTVEAINELVSGGDGIIELTAADYDFPTANPTGIAIWLLPTGIYKTKDGVSLFYGANASGGTQASLIVVHHENQYPSAVVYNWGTVQGEKTGGLSLGYSNESGSLLGTTYNKIVTADSLQQSAGNSIAYAMSQNATSSMVFADPSTRTRVQIGSGSSVGSNRNVAIGQNATASNTNTLAVGSYSWTNAATATAVGDGAIAGGVGSTAIGYLASAGTNAYSVALGEHSITSRNGEVNVGTGQQAHGFNSTKYRVIGGVHDGVDAHDATTVGQVNTRLGGLTLLPITQAAYDALATKDANTLYVITGA